MQLYREMMIKQLLIFITLLFPVPAHCRPHRNMPPLIRAIHKNQVKKVERLLQKEPGLAHQHYNGCTPLSLCFHPNKPIGLARSLLEHGANPNAQFLTLTLQKFNELGVALAYGTDEQIQILLDAQADPHTIIGIPSLLIPYDVLWKRLALIEQAQKSTQRGS